MIAWLAKKNLYTRKNKRKELKIDQGVQSR